MTANERLAISLQELACELARSRPAAEQRMDVASPWEPGLTHEQRRKAWLSTLSALDALHAEITELAETAASQATEYGADYRDLAEATGSTRRAARRRWPHLAAVLKGTNSEPSPLAASGTLTATGRAATLRRENRGAVGGQSEGLWPG